ncbi:hypothetical protein [Haloarchaeobius sp. DFWS5]|uniref:hypothetical protein n=1 Tax=Haloarchaeobius sp. DFWS5 TaxID=3446114 RepID=UPI003EC06A85
MREFDEALGNLVSCCSTMRASFEGVWDQDQYRIFVEHRGRPFTIFGKPSDGYFRITTTRRLLNIEGFEISQSTPVVNIRTELNRLYSSLDMRNIEIFEITETKSNDPVEYFDGFRAVAPIFVYEDRFGPKRFDESLCQIDRVVTDAFQEAVDIIGVDIEGIEETVGSDDTEVDTGGRAFQ